MIPFPFGFQRNGTAPRTSALKGSQIFMFEDFVEGNHFTLTPSRPRSGFLYTICVAGDICRIEKLN